MAHFLDGMVRKNWRQLYEPIALHFDIKGLQYKLIMKHTSNGQTTVDDDYWECRLEVVTFYLWRRGHNASSHINPNFGLSRKFSRISGRGFRAKFSLRHSQFHPEIQEKGCFPLNLHFIFLDFELKPSSACCHQRQGCELLMTLRKKFY